jgi:hypothetical protein
VQLTGQQELIKPFADKQARRGNDQRHPNQHDQTKI